MIRQEFDEKIKSSKALLKNEPRVSLANANLFSRVLDGIGKKILTAGLVLTMVFSGLALTGCNDKKPPQQENPPIVDPIEPEEPEKPGPVEPDPEEPEKPNPEDPDDSKEDEDKEKEKEKKIAQNIYAGIEDKLNKKIGGSTINKIMAIDYGKGNNGSNYVYTLVDFTTTNRHLIELYRIPMETEMTEGNILSGNVKTNKYDPTTMFTVDANSLQNINTDTSKAIYNKVKSENLLESNENPIMTSYITTTGSTDNVLGGYSCVHLYTISPNEIERNEFAVKSDVYENNAITDHLINGTFNKTFKQITQNTFYHKFSDHALVNYEGIDYEIEEQAITVDGIRVGT